ncbi:MAG: Rad52/Rad22 family DNA repair protein [Cyanobacteria bacterium P01_D01_bin.105]
MTYTQTIPPNTATPIPPQAPGEWSLSQIQAALSRDIPANLMASRRQGSVNVNYIPWHRVNKILDKYAPGWAWEICKIGMSKDRLFVVGRLTVPTSDGHISREATGTEALKRQTDEGEIVELAYGDPSSNAESMAFRRAAARFGLGLYLYQKD